MSKKILGFDVGIKNLAFCILNADDKEYKIEKWGIINLDDDRKVCQYMLRTNKECGKTANFSYFNKEKNNDSYLCKSHHTKYIPENYALEDTKESDKFCTYQECIDDINKSCNKKSNCTLLGTYYCKTHGKQELKKLERENKIKKLSDQSCNKLPIITLTKKLCEKLDNHPDFLQVDEVLIENQPSMLNPKMKTISSILYSYFMINGIGNVIKNKSTISNVKFNAPSNKLKVNKDGTAKILKLAKNKKEEYEYTKELGILYCKELIKNDNLNLDYLSTEFKKDDLCDAFLHGFQYYYNNKKLLDEKKVHLDKVVETYYNNISANKKNITEQTPKNNKVIKLKKENEKPDLDKIEKPKKKYNPFPFRKKKKGITINL